MTHIMCGSATVGRVINPFQVTKPVAPAEVIDREDETARLVSLAEEANNARLVAPRRYGKTSLLRRVQQRLDRAGWVTVYVDLLGIVTLEDFAQRVERAYSDALTGTIGKWFAGLRRSLRPALTIGGGPVPVSASLDLGAGRREALVARLALPTRVFEKTGQRVHVVFDEFQELRRGRRTSRCGGPQRDSAPRRYGQLCIRRFAAADDGNAFRGSQTCVLRPD